MLSQLVRPLRDHRLNPVPSQPATDAGITVSLVAGHAFRATSPTDAHGRHQPFEPGRLVPLSGGGVPAVHEVAEQIQRIARE